MPLTETTFDLLSRWDKKFLDLCGTIEKWSKDPSTQVAAVIVGPDNEVRSLGYNGLPRGVEDKKERYEIRPEKYKWVEHAERNAIYNAARSGTPLQDCTIYLKWFPCCDCARAIIQSGLMKMVCEHPDVNMPKWGADFKISLLMLEEAGIEVLTYARVA